MHLDPLQSQLEVVDKAHHSWWLLSYIIEPSGCYYSNDVLQNDTTQLSLYFRYSSGSVLATMTINVLLVFSST